MRVGNIAAGQSASVELDLVVPLIVFGGEATFRFPLVVAPRYIPGAALDVESAGSGIEQDTDAVPDASRISPPVLLPGFPSRVRLNIEATIDGNGLQISNIASSLHAVTTHTEGNRTLLRVQPGERVDRDFILRFQVVATSFGTSFVVVPDAEGTTSTFLFSMVPPMATADVRRPRDIAFVLDRSGSMGGWKMVAARRALGRMVDTLGPEDRFEILAFDTSVETFSASQKSGSQMMGATNRLRYRAIEWLSQIEARGGTEMADPIASALRCVGGGYADRDRYVVLVTDGQVGNEDQIIKHAQAHNQGAHIFTVGIDEAVNSGFLNRLAEITRGRCELVESEDRLDEIMNRVHEMIETPVLREVGLRIEGGQVVPQTLVPNGPLTLFAGAPLTLMGRLTGPGPFRATVRGATSGAALHEETLTATPGTESELSAIWARAQIRSLEDLAAAEPQRLGQLRQQIIDTSLRFKVLCRFTAFVAVDHASKVEGPLHKVTQAVEMPSGWDMAKGASFGGAPGSAPGGFPGVLYSSAALPQSMSAPAPSRPMAKKESASQGRSRGFIGDIVDRISAPFRAEEVASYEDAFEVEEDYETGMVFEVQAPEPQQMAKSHDPIFMLGSWLFELLTGRLWDGDLSGAGVFEEILKKALGVKSSSRYATIADFAEAIREVAVRENLNLSTRSARPIRSLKDLISLAPVNVSLASRAILMAAEQLVADGLEGDEDVELEPQTIELLALS
jgi:Ca-activated chloride channel family protein